MSIASVMQLKEYMGVAGASDDVLMDRLLKAAEAFFLMLTNRKSLAVASFTQTLDGTGKDYVQLHYFPIVSITSVVVAGDAVAPANYTFGAHGTLDDRVLYLTPASGLVFPKGRRNVVVSGTSGYSATPDDVVQAVLEIAARGYQKRKRIDETSKQVGGETVSYSAKDLTDFSRQVVANYTNRIPL